MKKRTPEAASGAAATTKLRRRAPPGKAASREPDLPLPFPGHDPVTAPVAYEPPIPLDEPPADPKSGNWSARVPVFQWEIDPTDAERSCGSAELRYLGWEFRMWWEKHPAGLVYASIQASPAVRDSHPGGWAFLPERALTARLVYDDHRHGIVAIHGTAKNFRPFVEAFFLGFGLERPPASA